MAGRVGTGRHVLELVNAISNAVGYAKIFSRSHKALIRVFDEAGTVIETHEHDGDFQHHLIE